ncbi:MAG: TRAP transporter substrate-binding protein [Rhodobacteraceae bacterium]|nr:TRAP transporter substrate-binding protein [Paracoccaceae bacterium]
MGHTIIQRIAALSMTAMTILGLGGPGPVFAANAIAAALSYPGDPTDQYWQIYARDLRAANAGIDLTLLTRGEIGSEEQILPATRRGRVQLAGFTTSGLEALIPEFALFLAPYLFESFDEVDFVLDNYLAVPMAELCASKGLVMLTWYDEGWRNLFSKTQMNGPGDVRNYRFRALQAKASQEFLGALGADVIPIPFPEVIPGLQTGLIDGGEIGVYMYRVSGVRDVAPYYTLTEHAYSTGIISANKPWFDSLTPAEQEAIRATVPKAPVARRLMRDAAASGIDAVIAGGAHVQRLTPEQRAAWAAAVAPTHRQLIDNIGGDAQRIYDLIVEAKRAFAAQPNN